MIRHKPIFWFPFCPADWISVVSSRGLSMEARGVFITLLCFQWQEPSRCLSADNATLLRILNCSPSALLEVLPLFSTVPGEPSRIRYTPLESAYQEASISHEKRAKAGRLGAFKTNSRFTSQLAN